MNQKALIRVLAVVLVVVITIQVIESVKNRSLINKLNREKDIERRESEKKIESLNKSLIDKEKEFNKKILIFEKSKDSVNGLYEKSNRELQKIKTDISNYLISSDSIRFSKFKQLITEMD